jgi:polysaccharide biosynthesis transport protein
LEQPNKFKAPEPHQDIRVYLRLIQKRKFIILFCMAAAIAMALYMARSTAPQYTASSKIIIERRNFDTLMNTMFYVPWDPDFIETQVQVMRSVPVAQRVAKLLDLEENYESYLPPKTDQGFTIKDNFLLLAKSVAKPILKFFGVNTVASNPLLRQDSENDFAAKADNRPSKVKLIARQISGGIQIEPIELSRVFTIRYTSFNPELAKLVVNSVVEAYVEQILEMQLASSTQSLKWLSRKAQEERIRLEASEEKLQQYMRQQDILTIEGRSAVIPEKLGGLSVKLTNAESKRKKLENLIEFLNSAENNLQAAEAVPEINSNGALDSLRKMIHENEQHILTLSKTYGDKHPQMKKAQATHKMLLKKRSQEIQRIIQLINNRYKLALSEENSIHGMLEQTKEEAGLLNEKLVQQRFLEREIESNRFLYDALLKKIKEQNITYNAQRIEVKVLEKAETPGGPSNYRTKRGLLHAGIAGFVLGILIIFTLEYFDQTIKTASDAESRLGAPILGCIQKSNGKQKNINLIPLKDPQSWIAESYRSIRTALIPKQA